MMFYGNNQKKSPLSEKDPTHPLENITGKMFQMFVNESFLTLI